MATFDDIVNNPNFGRLYSQNSQFREMFSRYQSNAFGDANLLSKFGIDIRDGQVSYTYEPMGNTRFSRIEDAMDAVLFNRGLKSTRTYRASGDSFSTGGYSNPVARWLTQRHPELSVRVRSFNPTSATDYDWMIRQMSGPDGQRYGLQNFGDGLFRVMDVIGKDGQRKTFQQIQNLLGLTLSNKGSAFKRTNVLTNDEIFSSISDANNPILAATFDPRKVIEMDPARKQIAEGTARRIFENQTGRSYDDILNEVYTVMTDGMNFQTFGSFRREMGENISRGRKLRQEGRNIMRTSGVGSSAYRNAEAMVGEGQAIIDAARQQLRTMNDGSPRRLRLVNALNPLTGDRIQFGKGDLHLISENTARAILGSNGQDISGFDVNSLGAIMSRADVKTEMTTNAFSLKTMAINGTSHAGSINILSASVFQNIIDTDDYLASSMRNEIADHIANLKRGQISPGLRRTLDEMKSWTPLESDGPAARAAALEGRQFARRLEAMVSRGQGIETNDLLTSQLYSAMSKHYMRFRKGKFGQTLTLGGKEIPYFDGGFPMQGSTRAHILSVVHSSQGPSPLRGSAQVRSGVIAIHGDDVVRVREALGGMDLDDELEATLRYDDEARRLLYHIRRDPDEMGEYFMMDADITHDKNIPLKVRQLWSEQKHLLTKIHNSPNVNAADKVANLKRVDEIRNTLDRYLRGETVTIQGEALQQNFIKKFRSREVFEGMGRGPKLYAPKGFEYAGSSGPTFLRSLQTSRMISGPGANYSSVRSALQREFAAQTSTDVPGSLFRYMGTGYDAYHGRTGYFTKSRTLENLLNKPAASLGPMTLADIERRSALEFRTRGLLGRYVNQASAIDDFIASHLHKGSDVLAQALQETLRATPFTHIDREIIIDTIKKNGDEAIAAEIENVLSRDAHNFGRIVASLQQRGLGDVGVDEIMAQTRLEKVGFEKGYASVMGIDSADVNMSMYSLGASDPKAFAASKFKQLLDISTELGEEGQRLSEAAAQNMLDDLSGLDLSAERSAASDLIDNFYKQSRDIQTLMDGKDADALASMMSDFMDGTVGLSDADIRNSVLEGFDIDDVNTSTLRRMQQLGITDQDAIDRHLLAMAQIVSENGIAGGRGSMAPLMSMGGEGETSVFDMFLEARQRLVDGPRAMNRLAKVRDAEGLAQFISANGELTALSKSVFDRTGRNLAILDRIQDLAKTQGRTKFQPQVESLLIDIMDSGQVDTNTFQAFSQGVRSYYMNAGQTVPSLRIPYAQRQASSAVPPGSARIVNRTIADTASESVTRTSVRESMERFEFSKAWNSRGGRAAILGAGAFAAVGILHRLTKDPTPEEMEGPPLLPSSSPYDGYGDLAQPASMYSQQQSPQAMMYTIRATGDFDPAMLSQEMSAIGGGTRVTSNIYQPTGPRMDEKNHSARVRLLQFLQGDG